MDSERGKKQGIMRKFGVFLSMLVFFCAGHPARAEFTPGNTYDKSNVQEIVELLPESIRMWITEDQYVMKTGEIKDWGHSAAFLKLSQENNGKFDVNENGDLTYKNGETPTFFMGMPFPSIDSADPKAGAKIIQNMFAARYYNQGAGGSYGTVYYLNGKGGPTRSVGSGVVNLFYWNRRNGEIPNPNNFISQRLNYVLTPMELKGTTQMAWSYTDERTDSAFAYVPAVRRVRRVSAASRSDPFLGCDGTVDDVSGFDGKPSSMIWRLVGEKTMLMPVTTLETVTFPLHPDGSYTKTYETPIVLGYKDKNWTGPNYSPISLFWVPREVYLIEAIPKDQYYNYSKYTMYIDKEILWIHAKDGYDRSGEYWKTQLEPNKKSILSNGEPIVGMAAMDFYVDWKAKHSTAVLVGDGGSGITMDGNLPLSKVGPKYFTEANLKQLSK